MTEYQHTKPETGLEIESRLRAARARAFIPPQYRAEFDAGLAHVWDGHHAWTMLWMSLSREQRRLMSTLGDGEGVTSRIVTFRSRPATALGMGKGPRFRKATVGRLVELGLLDGMEPATGAEWAVTASAKGRAMLSALRSRN